MSYWSKKKSQARRFARGKVNHYRRGIRHTRRINNKYDIIGLTPDHWVSPIDFVPYYGQVRKGTQIYKQRKRAVRGVKYTYRTAKRVVGKKPRRSSPSSRTRRKPGTRPYYYYKGKRIYYANNKYRKGRK